MYNGLNKLLPTIQETNHLMEVRWLKKLKIKCMVMYLYPTCDMHFVYRKDELISEISFGVLYIFKRLNVLQIFFLYLIERKVRFITIKQYFFNIIAFKFFRQFQNLSEETGMEPCR